MKRLLTFTTLLLSFTVFSQNNAPEVIPLDNAILKTCEYHMMGCVPRIVIGGKQVVIDQETIPKDIKSKTFNSHGNDIELGKIQGVIVEDIGHSGSPSSKRQVFKILLKDSNAYVTTCSDGIMGCAPTISIKGQVTLIDQAMTPSDILDIRGGLIPVNVTGYYQKENGHFPNPTAVFKVFKPIYITMGDQLDTNTPIIDGSKHELKQNFEQEKPSNNTLFESTQK
jgi:hypothetical protein